VEHGHVESDRFGVESYEGDRFRRWRLRFFFELEGLLLWHWLSALVEALDYKGDVVLGDLVEGPVMVKERIEEDEVEGF